MVLCLKTWYNYPYIITMENIMDENILKVGKYNTKFNDILGLDIAELDIYKIKGITYSYG